MWLITWILLVFVASSRLTAASECGKMTSTSMYSGMITSPLETSNKTCQWNIELSPKYTLSQIHFHDLTLRNCTNCSCDYIEVWNARIKDPEHWVGKFCGDLSGVYHLKNQSNHLLIELWSTSWSGMKPNHTFLSYRGIEQSAQHVEDCGKMTNITMDRGTITSPIDPSNKKCLWYIEVSSRQTEIGLDLHNLKLRDCTNCSCDYIEVWSSRTKDPKHWVGKFCGDFKYKYITTKGNKALVEFGSTSWSGMKGNHTFLSYQGRQLIICFIPDDYHYGIHSGPRSTAFAVTAIGIVFSLLLLLGALGCGVYLFKRAKPSRGRRARRRRPTPLQHPTQQDGNIPPLPKLPNYFDTDNNSVLPPYLGFNGEAGKGVGESELPPPYDEPPPYSITEAAETVGVETTVQKVIPESSA